MSPGFRRRVYEVVRRIPAGRVTTYGDVATMVGSPRVARQVGWALAALGPEDDDVPWHRVINAQGRITIKGDLLRPDEQRRRLIEEGVAFDDHDRVDLASVRWVGE